MLVTQPFSFARPDNRPRYPPPVEELLDAERDAVRLVVDLDDLDLDGLADVDDLGRVVDAPPRHVGDVQEAVDAAEIDEGAVLGDVLDHAVDDLALFEVRHGSKRCSANFSSKHRAARYDDVAAAAAVHLEDLEGLRTPMGRVTSRTRRISTWLRGRKATAPSRSTV